MIPQLRASALSLVIAGALMSCQSSDTSENATPGPIDSAASADTAGAMAGMAGMSDTTGAAAMDSMQAHLRMMDTMSADQIKSMLPMHRQRVANLLSRMNADMRDMDMSSDRAWTATIDSLRQDLVRMPESAPGELKAMMPAHHARMTRLMRTHRAMMGG